MIYAFEDFLIDTDRRELRCGRDPIHLQPQVFDLLLLLVENAHRVVTRDELVEKVWNGRIVSEDAIASRIRDLRRALNDSAREQRFVRTMRAHGLRFVGDVAIKARAQPDDPAEEMPEQPDQLPGNEQPSIAVLPFQRVGDHETLIAVEEAIPRELISTLASLRWVKVISFGSTSRFRNQHVDVADVGRLLRARYCLTGMVELAGARVIIDVELSDTRNSQVIWAMRKQAPVGDIQALRAEIAANIIGVTELEIPQHEAGSLGHLEAESLDAWSAMHVGFQHLMYFSREGNRIAENMLRAAMEKEPRLARAYSGLAFVHFQNAFLRYETDVVGETQRAKELAEHSLMLQPQDPFGNFMMGRCHWLENDPAGSKPWFQRAIDASPNYTWGHYGTSWASVFTNDFNTAMCHADQAIDLSPIDPFRPGMTGNKMWIHIAREEYAQAVQWAEIAARTPWAHAGMALFAAMSHWLNGDPKRVEDWMDEVRRRNPDFGPEHLAPLVPSSSTEFRNLVADFSRSLQV